MDCLRVSLSPVAEDETDEQRAKRLAAQWDSDCSFEAEGTGNSKNSYFKYNQHKLKKKLK